VKKVIHQVGYNSQRDNFNFAGKFPGWKQCFSTSAFMFASFYSDKVDAKNEEQLKWYVDQAEAGVGVKGIAEKVIRKLPWIPKSGSSYWWDVHKDLLQYIFDVHEVKKNVVWYNDAPFFSLDTSIGTGGPAIVGTSKMGGLPGGHIVLVIGIDDDSYYLNDPYGNPLSNYREHNGACIKVPKEWFRIQCERAAGNGLVRFMEAV
jgi:hypothetical protein